jgi:hypothetical protein
VNNKTVTDGVGRSDSPCGRVEEARHEEEYTSFATTVDLANPDTMEAIRIHEAKKKLENKYLEYSVI